MKNFFTTLFVCHMVFLGACQINTQKQMHAQDQKEIIIPLDLSTRRPIVELTINGKGPYKFIFDTGSTTHVIDEKLNAEAGFKTIGENALRTPGSDSRLMSKKVLVPDVGPAGTSIFKDVEMNVINLRAMLPVDGILSGIFFEDYLLSIDYPGSGLIITSGELNKNDDGVIPFLQKPRVINLNVDVDGNSMEAHLDTGNPGFFSLPYAMKDRLKFKSEPVKRGNIRTPVASFKRWSAELIGAIKVGNIIYKNPKVSLIEGFEFVNLGYAVVKDLKTTIDRKNNLIKFERSSAETNIEQSKKEHPGPMASNDFTGWYGGKVRRIFLNNGDLYLQRADFKLKLVYLNKDLYKMVYTQPTNNELPHIRFERNKAGQVTGLTFLFKDGREDYVRKDR